MAKKQKNTSFAKKGVVLAKAEFIENTGLMFDELLLLVVDAQERLLDKIDQGEHFKKRLQFVVDVACIMGINIAFTEQCPDKLGATWSSLLTASPKSPRFAKKTFSALACPHFSDWLEKQPFKHILVVGLETPVCIYQTVLDLIHKDLECTLLVDALGSRCPKDADSVLKTLKGASCHCLPSETVFYSMLRSSDHPLFKALNEKVKQLY